MHHLTPNGAFSYFSVCLLSDVALNGVRGEWQHEKSGSLNRYVKSLERMGPIASMQMSPLSFELRLLAFLSTDEPCRSQL